MMDNDLYDKYVAEIRSGCFNCIVVNGQEVRRFKAPGVKTLFELLNNDPAFLSSAIVFDSVVGKGAASLMIAGHIKSLYAQTISRHAIDFLEKYSIPFQSDNVVPFIENRTRSGLCPVESLSIGCSSPEEVTQRIAEFISKMNPPIKS